MRYEDFRDCWRAALTAANLPMWPGGADETLDLNTMARRWSASVLGNHVGTLHAGATIGFIWSPFQTARGYSCEEDLQTQLFGNRASRPTKARYVRVDLLFRASLTGDTTSPMPTPDVWAHWITVMQTQLDAALALPPPKPRGEVTACRGGVEVDARPTSEGAIAFHGLSDASRAGSRTTIRGHRRRTDGGGQTLSSSRRS